MSSSLFEDYIKYLIEYVVAFGERSRWTPEQIGKTFILLAEELGIIIPVSVGKHPFIAPTQNPLHRDYIGGRISTDPSRIETQIIIKTPIGSENIEEDLNSAYSSIQMYLHSETEKIFPYLRNSKYIKNRLIDIGECKTSPMKDKIMHLAKEADHIYFNRGKKLRLDYLHPNIYKNTGNIQNAEDLNSLLDVLQKLKNSTNLIENLNIDVKYLENRLRYFFSPRELFALKSGDEKYFKDAFIGTEAKEVSVGPRLREEFRSAGHPLSDNAKITRNKEIIDGSKLYQIVYYNGLNVYQKAEKAKMTESWDSTLKRGTIKFVSNYRYLEVLRKNNKPIIFNRGDEKFVMAFGKPVKGSISPNCVEIYIFNVIDKDEHEIDDLCNYLERYMQAILAEKFKISPEWRNDITKGKEMLERPLYGSNTDDNSISDLGEYGGEVYVSMSCEIKKYLNFPMEEKDIDEYLREFVGQSIRAILDPDVHAKVNNDKEIKTLINAIKEKKINNVEELNNLEDELYNLLKNRLNPQRDEIRPLYLPDAFDKGFNCEQIISLTLNIMNHNKKSFHAIEKLYICYLPKEFLRRYLGRLYMRDSHLCIIFKLENDKDLRLFDPAKIIPNSIKTGLINCIISKSEDEGKPQPYYIPYNWVEFMEGKNDR